MRCASPTSPDLSAPWGGEGKKVRRQLGYPPSPPPVGDAAP